MTALRIQNVSKRFGATVALNDVSFEVSAGQVHALLGENGAGKSTLMHIAYGLLRPDAGTIGVSAPDGRESTTTGFASPRDARRAGIGMVHQHFTSIPAFTVAENIALTAGWKETGRAAERRADGVVQRLGLPLPVAEYAEQLSVQLRQRLEIVKALAADAQVLILDEPTAALAPREVAELLKFIRAFAAGGGAVALITHKLDEVFHVADHVTVLRRGEVVLDSSLDTQSPQSLARAMIGADLPRAMREASNPGDVLVRITPTSGSPLEIRAGEIVGVAAIDGNGQRELLRAIAGVDDAKLAHAVLDAIGPVAFIPEDRTSEGLIGSFTLAENFVLGAPAVLGPWLDWNDISKRTDELLRSHDVRAANAGVTAATLSGGNQQKFIFARATAGSPRVIVAEDPTRGLDIMATAAIHQRLRDAAHNGAAVIVHSSDLDEVLAVANRLLVVARGEVRELPVTAPRELIGDAMLALETIQ